MTILQCALDVVDLDLAVSRAEVIGQGGATWIEVGTPLIKSAGMHAVRTFKSRFANTPVVADLKTLDFGDLEVSIAAQAGADVVTVSAAASDQTIVSAARCARRYGIQLVASLMGVETYERRTAELASLGVHRVLAHFSAETDFVTSRLDIYSRVASSTSLPVGIGGGITADNVGAFAARGCEYFVVGRAIAEAENPGQAVQSMLSAIANR